MGVLSFQEKHLGLYNYEEHFLYLTLNAAIAPIAN